jgi:RNA polymerase sigma factor (sigma-70 family)
VATPFDDPVERIERRHTRSQRLRALRAALGGLSAEDRRLIRLRYWDGWQVRTMARLLDVDERSLYGRLRRLLRTLHKAVAVDA